MNRRSFVRKLAGIGLFTILPGAGRVWKAERQLYVRMPNYLVQHELHNELLLALESDYFKFVPSFQDFLKVHDELCKGAVWRDNLGDPADNRPLTVRVPPNLPS